MNIVIVGDGKVGFTLAKELSYEGHDIVMIDTNEYVLDDVQGTLDVMTVQGNGASLEVQREAGVPDADLLIAATSGDEVNLLCCILARKLGCKHTIARVRNPEYEQQLSYMREDLGLSMVVNPEKAAAMEIFRLLQFPSFLKRDTFARGRVELVELKIKPDSVLDGVELSRFYEIAKVRVLVCCVDRDNATTIPSGHFVLRAGDKITVTAASRDLVQFIKNIGISNQKVRNVVIIGGSRIAVYLTQELLASRVDVKIIEIDPDRCRELSEMLPDALIIEGNGTSSEVLQAEDVAGSDAVVTLTGIDEENLITSMYINYLGVPRSIPKINRVEYTDMLCEKGIDSFVSPKLLTADEIVRFVRAMETTDSAVLTLTRIADGDVEASEFVVPENFRGSGIPLVDLPVRPRTLVACIGRGAKIIIPSGTDAMQPGDTVVVITSADEPIVSLSEILAEDDTYDSLAAAVPLGS